MISISSSPSVLLHPTLGSTGSSSVPSSSSPTNSSNTTATATTTTTTTTTTASSTSISSDYNSSSPRNSSSSSSPSMLRNESTIGSSGHISLSETLASPSSSDVGAECKRPSHYLVHSHSSRHVNLTDEITPREMALSIIQAQYHIYHTDLSGYLAGGDMVQDALTRYALGGTPKDLYQTYKRFKQDKERIPPAPTITITTRNWRDWLGHKSYYHDYLDFFDHELSQLEARILQGSSSPLSSPTATKPSLLLSTSWSVSHSSPLAESMAKMVSDYLTPLIPGLCASTGALIHLGYGVEFGSRLLIAEGLAYACISYQPATACYIPTAASGATSSWSDTSSTKLNAPQQKRSPTVSILNMIRNDKRLDGMFDAGFQAKLNVVMSSRVSLLKSYLGMWTSQVHSVSEALLDLSQTSGLLLFTATNRFGDEQQLDKNLANILLATHAARFLVKVLPSEFEKEQLLKAIWMSLVATFVVQGRPRLIARTSSSQSVTADGLPQEKEQESSMTSVVAESEGTGQGSATKFGMATIYFEPEATCTSADRWKSLSLEAIHADHRIVPKIVRSLFWAELEHGECNDLFYELALRAIGDDPASDESTGPGF